MYKNLIMAGLVIVTFACEPSPESTELLDDLVVVTNYDTTATFNSYATFAIPSDTILLYSNAVADSLVIQGASSDYPRPVVEAIKSNMASRGYTEVKHNENPDLGIIVSLVHDFNVYQQVNYGGYGGYGGYYGYGYGYNYPSYYVSTTTSNKAALIIEMVDLKNKVANRGINVIWTVNMGDLIHAIDLKKQSIDAINQSFTQSTYVSK